MARSYADVFLADILGNPDDDTPRLVYADWLEEHGEADRAEFIRAQCGLAKGYLPADRRMPMEQRAWKLLVQHGEQWARPIRRWVHSWQFHRGFVGEVSVDAGRFFACAGQLFRRAPIQHLRLWREDGPPAQRQFNVPALAESECLCRLRGLDLTDNRLESVDLRALAVSPYLGGLTALRLAHNRIGNAGARALDEAPMLATLIYLDLSHNTIGAAGADALAEALRNLALRPDGLRLRRLYLGGNTLGVAGRRALASSPILRRLVRG